MIGATVAMAAMAVLFVVFGLVGLALGGGRIGCGEACVEHEDACAGCPRASDACDEDPECEGAGWTGRPGARGRVGPRRREATRGARPRGAGRSARGSGTSDIHQIEEVGP